MVYCKGADNVMLERIKAKQKDKDDLEDALRGYAQEGLRTLVLASRELKEEAWRTWDQKHKDASAALQDREEELMLAAELVERDMEVVGATAIEDKLQAGVPDTIATLAQAGIRIWVECQPLDL